jgi:membrane protein YqaA with SNARE-associated domain
MTRQRWVVLGRVLILVGVIALTIFLYLMRVQIKHLEVYGYPGIFLVSILANATVIVPLPGVVITSAMGAVFNPFWVAIAAGSGATLGELTGYLAGYSGRGVAERVEFNRKVGDAVRKMGIFGRLLRKKEEDEQGIDWQERFEGWLKRYGGILITLLAFIPNPLFDMAGMFAGVVKMPVWKFLLYSWIGKVMKMLMFAYGGATIFGLFN